MLQQLSQYDIICRNLTQLTIDVERVKTKIKVCPTCGRPWEDNYDKV
jgi:hypothetical protein